MTDLDKVIKISEFIVKKMVYKSTDGLYDGTNDLYYPLVLGYGQCHNYAQSFNFLANLVGLVSYSAFAGALHEWNLVKIDRKFYHLDLTWADQGDTLDYRFVNVSTNTIDTLHGFKFNYPTDEIVNMISNLIQTNIYCSFLQQRRYTLSYNQNRMVFQVNIL